MACWRVAPTLAAAVNYDRRGQIAPCAGDAHDVAEAGQLIGGGSRYAVFEIQFAGNEFMHGERAIEMLGLEAWGFDRFLCAHAELDEVENDLQQRLILVVGAGSGERVDRFAVFED